jgi:phosphatidate cytidylyltransferase
MPSARRPASGRERPRGGRRGGEERRRRPELLTRILVAVPLAVVTVVFIDVGGLPFALLLIAAGWVCMFELYRLLGRWRPVPLVGIAALAGMVLGARYGSQREVLEVAVAAVPVLFLLVVAIAATLLGIYWIGFAFAHAELLRQVRHGDGIIIDVLVGTFVGDTAAYFGGRVFGRTPLAPKISPNKTVEGLFCGMVLAIVAVFLAGLYQDWLTQGDAILLGVAVAVLGPIGDLFESLVKRDAGAKDAGTIFGPHGGVLDRIDGALFTVVAGYYIWLSVMH